MKARIENGAVRLYGALPSRFSGVTGNYAGGFHLLDAEIHRAEGFYELEQPEFDESLQRLGAIYFDQQDRVFRHQVIAKTPEEIAQEREALASSMDGLLDATSIRYLLALLTGGILRSGAVTREQLAALGNIHPMYRENRPYRAGDVFSYYGELYEVVQPHTSQPDWIPSGLPALYKRFTPAGEIAPWVQPLGSEDAYHAGDRVSHNGAAWENTVEGNVWEPGVYGWVQLP